MIGIVIGAAVAAIAIVLVTGPADPGRKGPQGPSFRPGETNLLYERTAEWPTELDQPLTFEVAPDGRLFVAGMDAVEGQDTPGAFVAVLSDDGAPQSRFPIAAEPTCLDIGPDGTVYVTSATEVFVYTPDGELQATWSGFDEGTSLKTIAASVDDIYVGDQGNQIIYRCDTDGEIFQRLLDRDGDDKENGLIIYQAGLDVMTDPEGFWTVNPGRHKLQLHTPDGSMIRSWGRASLDWGGFCGCCNPTRFVRLSDGRFVTVEKHLRRIQLFDADGRFLGGVAPAEDFDGQARRLDLALDNQDRILVLDPATRNVCVYEPKEPKP